MIKYSAIYFFIVSLLAIILTIDDKLRAKKSKWRISEKALFLTAVFGGAIAEYFTMKIIHHKTKHKKFMIGLPIIIVLQITIIILTVLKVAY